MANIIATYNASELGLEGVDMETAYLHEERDYNNEVTGYWWLDNTHHDFSGSLGIYQTVEDAENALRSMVNEEVEAANA